MLMSEGKKTLYIVSSVDMERKRCSLFCWSVLLETKIYYGAKTVFDVAENWTISALLDFISESESGLSMGKPLAVAPNSRDSGVARGSPQKGHISGRTAHYSITSL